MPRLKTMKDFEKFVEDRIQGGGQTRISQPGQTEDILVQRLRQSLLKKKQPRV